MPPVHQEQSNTFKFEWYKKQFNPIRTSSRLKEAACKVSPARLFKYKHRHQNKTFFLFFWFFATGGVHPVGRRRRWEGGRQRWGQSYLRTEQVWRRDWLPNSRFQETRRVVGEKKKKRSEKDERRTLWGVECDWTSSKPFRLLPLSLSPRLKPNAQLRLSASLPYSPRLEKKNNFFCIFSFFFFFVRLYCFSFFLHS